MRKVGEDNHMAASRRLIYGCTRSVEMSLPAEEIIADRHCSILQECDTQCNQNDQELENK